MSYVVIKTIKGRQYRYLQTSTREGKKVRTKSKYLGAAGGLFTGSGNNSEEGEELKRRKERARELGFALADIERERLKEVAAFKATHGCTPEEHTARETHEKQFDQARFLEETQEKAPTDGEGEKS